MTAVLLSVHMLAAILAVGPIAVAASLFPRLALAGSDAGPAATAALLHRICRVYSLVGIAVPVFGIVTAVRMGVLGTAWLGVSMLLTAVAAGVLVIAIVPGQRRLLAGVDRPAEAARRLTMATGVFNLLWAVVTVLMIVRPGSTTGV